MNGSRGWCFLIILSLIIGCATTYAEEEVFIPKILESLPQQLEVDFERNLLLYASYNKLYAYDLETGNRRWWKQLIQEDKGYEATLGKDYVVMHCVEDFIVLDTETGGELWKEYARNSQTYRYLSFLPQTNWLWFQDYPKDDLYYINIDDRKGYKIPVDMRLIPSIPPVSNRVFYGLKLNNSSEIPTQMDVYFWEASSPTPEKKYVIESQGQLYYKGISGNELLTSIYSSDKDSDYIFRVYNIETGEAIREFSISADIIPREKSFHHPHKHNFYFWNNEDENVLYRLDAVTGELVSVSFPEEHNLWLSRRTNMGVYEDLNGLWWFVTRDSDCNFWLLPFNHNATPRKLLNGKRFLPVECVFRRNPPPDSDGIRHLIPTEDAT